MTKLEQMNLKRNAEWTKKSLFPVDWNGRPLEQVVTKEIQSLPKDSNGLVVVPDNLSEDKLIVFKSVMTPKRVVSAFANAPVVNAFTDF